MFKNWFKKSKVEVADLEEIKIAPKIEIPEPTSRELYDQAVAEVQYKRVKELIRRELMSLVPNIEDIKKQTAEFNKKYGNGIMEGTLKVHIDEYPDLRFRKNDRVGYMDMEVDTYVPIDVEVYQAEALLDILTREYLKEQLNG